MQIKCYKCGNQFTMDMMRMDPNGKNLICRSCLERKPSAQNVSDVENPIGKKSKETKNEMLEYFCKDCKYNFKRAFHIDVRTCPYCSSKSDVQKGSTAKIIADAAKMKGD